MAEFESCDKCKHGWKTENDYPCNTCKHGVNIEDFFTPKTNADAIRQMSDEELAEFLCGIYDDEECFGKFINGIIIQNYDNDRIAEWLKSEVEE